MEDQLGREETGQRLNAPQAGVLLVGRLRFLRDYDAAALGVRELDLDAGQLAELPHAVGHPLGRDAHDDAGDVHRNRRS